MPRGAPEPQEVRVVLQASICPDSYQKVLLPEAGQFLGTSAVCSPSVQAEKWEEWHTKEKSATAVQAIVVHLC